MPRHPGRVMPPCRYRAVVFRGKLDRRAPLECDGGEDAGRRERSQLFRIIPFRSRVEQGLRGSVSGTAHDPLSEDCLRIRDRDEISETERDRGQAGRWRHLQRRNGNCGDILPMIPCGGATRRSSISVWQWCFGTGRWRPAKQPRRRVDHRKAKQAITVEVDAWTTKDCNVTRGAIILAGLNPWKVRKPRRSCHRQPQGPDTTRTFVSVTGVAPPDAQGFARGRTWSIYTDLQRLSSRAGGLFGDMVLDPMIASGPCASLSLAWSSVNSRTRDVLPCRLPGV